MITLIYKDVLWVDDIDDGNPGLADLDNEDSADKSNNVERFIRNNIENVKCIENFYDAAIEINKHSENYNLIIFDLNLEKGMEATGQTKRKVDDIFSNCNLHFNSIDESLAGIYLYFLLLAKGYPAKRIVILTANTLDKKNIQYFNLEKIRIEKNENNKFDVESRFQKKDNSYYRIRRLVLQACDYWSKELNNNCSIPFNDIYKDGYFKSLNTNQLLEMLEHLRMLFPSIMPNDPEAVYYQAARIVSMYHEEQANININYLKDNRKIQSLHSIVRHFRNKSAHNNFTSNEMNERTFALLFCISLRTYFDFKEDEDYSNDLFEYEKSFYSTEEIQHLTIDEENEFSKKIINKWEEVVSPKDDKTNFDIRKTCNFTYIFNDPKYVNKTKFKITDVFLPLIFRESIKETSERINGYSDERDVQKYSKKFIVTFNQEHYNNVITVPKDINSVEPISFFEREAFYLFYHNE